MTAPAEFDSPGAGTATAAAADNPNTIAVASSATKSSSSHPSHLLHSISSPSSSAGVTAAAAARGDRRSKLVRERSRSISSAAFAAASSSNNVAATSSGNGRTNNFSSTSSSPSSITAKEAESLLVQQSETIKQEQKSSSSSSSLPILFTSFCYKGFEVIFTAINYYHSRENDDNDNSEDNEVEEDDDDIEVCHLLGIHARTRAPFQKCYILTDTNMDDNTLNNSYRTNSGLRPILQPTTRTSSLPKNKMKKKEQTSSSGVEIVQVTSHPTSGYIFAADNFGNIHSFYPTPSDPMVEAYGKFRWKKGCVASCREIFGYCYRYRSGGSLTTTNHDNESSSAVMANDKRSTGADHQVEDAVVPIFFRRSNPRRSKTNPLPKSSPLTALGRNIAKIDEKVDHLVSNNDQPPLPTNNILDNDNDDINNGDRGGCGGGSGGGGTFGEDGVMICASMTERRVLIVHRDQLAIFDFSAQILSSSSSSLSSPKEALLLWTHKLQGCIIETASLSGDGCAVALVLRGEGIGVPYPFGVRTFVRDGEDGSGVSDETSTPLLSSSMVAGEYKVGKTSTASSDSSGGSIPNSSGGGGGKPPLHRAKRGNNTTKRGGILYKPAQFLVHSAPVTRLAFRGYGTRTSSANHNCTSWSEDMEGNDLLLTTCSSDCSVRIFSQNSWRQLMHWNSPQNSRADWVRGISAANLGDFDSSTPTSGWAIGSGSTSKKRSEEVVSTPPKPKGLDNASQHAHSSQNSHNAPSDNASLTSAVSAGINQSLLSTTHAQQNAAQLSPGLTVPSHFIPGTHAGAWIAELTFRKTFPALRLSRLSYLKTGGDDALPAHFESVAAILPPGSIAEEVSSGGHSQGLEFKTIFTLTVLFLLR